VAQTILVDSDPLRFVVPPSASIQPPSPRGVRRPRDGHGDLERAVDDGPSIRICMAAVVQGYHPHAMSPRPAAWALFLLLAACSREVSKAPQPPVPHEELRAMNVAAYETSRERLLHNAAGKWAVIVRGQAHSPFASFEEARVAADRLAPTDSHRFIWRPGTDDVRREFNLSMWRDEHGKKGNWAQLGLALSVRLNIAETLSPSAGTEWSLGGRTKSWPPGPAGGTRITLRLQAPCGDQQEDVDMVRSLSFVHDITVTPNVATRLEVERAAVPGEALPEGTDVRYRLALVRVKEPTLQIDELVVAFLVPQELWNRDG
jgi:hypothetical protein